MLEIEFREASLLKRLVESLKDISKEVNLVCHYEEISLQTMDESHVALIALSLRPDALLRYRCDSECVLGFDLTVMHKYIGAFANNRPLILRKQEGERQISLVGTSARQLPSSKSRTKTKDASMRRADQSENTSSANAATDNAADDEESEDRSDDEMSGSADTSSNVWNRVASVKLTSVEHEHYQTPEGIVFKSEICLPCSLFSHVVRANVGVSDSLKLTAKRTTLELSVDADLGHTSTIFHKGVGPFKDHNEYPWRWNRLTVDDAEMTTVGGADAAAGTDESVEMEVSLSYLQKFTKACPLSSKMYISMSPSIPLRLRFPIEADETNHSYLDFFLAPKIGDNDDNEQMT